MLYIYMLIFEYSNAKLQGCAREDDDLGQDDDLGRTVPLKRW